MEKWAIFLVPHGEYFSAQFLTALKVEKKKKLRCSLILEEVRSEWAQLKCNAALSSWVELVGTQKLAGQVLNKLSSSRFENLQHDLKQATVQNESLLPTDVLQQEPWVCWTKEPLLSPATLAFMGWVFFLDVCFPCVDRPWFCLGHGPVRLPMGLIAFPSLTAPLWRTEEAKESFTHSPL